jgi:Fe-S-cluster containining protein
MLVIGDVLVSDDLVKEKFVCDLHACKGACCTEGDYGAPVEHQEMETIKIYLDVISKNLPPASQEYLKNHDGFTFYKDPGVWGTSCHEDGACVFLTKNELGISVCGIEKTWYEGKIPFQKPISCHLYPVRIALNEISGFEAWNYDQWDICSAACTKGKKEKVPLYQFVKDAIIRKKGQDFFDEIHAAAEHLKT